MHLFKMAVRFRHLLHPKTHLRQTKNASQSPPNIQSQSANRVPPCQPKRRIQGKSEFSSEKGRVSFSRKSNAVEYSSDEENGKGNGNGGEEGGDNDDEEVFDWETEIRRTVKEIEEMRELGKMAEELQGRIDSEVSEGDDGDETEEEKKMRVRKDLEKVRLIYSMI